MVRLMNGYCWFWLARVVNCLLHAEIFVNGATKHAEEWRVQFHIHQQIQFVSNDIAWKRKVTPISRFVFVFFFIILKELFYLFACCESYFRYAVVFMCLPITRIEWMFCGEECNELAHETINKTWKRREKSRHTPNICICVESNANNILFSEMA